MYTCTCMCILLHISFKLPCELFLIALIVLLHTSLQPLDTTPQHLKPDTLTAHVPVHTFTCTINAVHVLR